MKGLIIWAQSNCRSMLGVYAQIKKIAQCPVVIAVHKTAGKGCAPNIRSAVGFSDSEFPDIELMPIGENREKGLELINRHPGYDHLFAVYQGSANFRYLICEAARRGMNVSVISESPCNMSTGLKGWLKDRFYFRYVLPRKVRNVIACSKRIINLSGDSTGALRAIGWNPDQIVPFGYFPPPIPDSQCVERTSNLDFNILVTGIMTWHRAPDVIMRALDLLKKWGVPFRATFTQKGPMLNELKQLAKDKQLPVEFAGFLPMPQLIKLYETCSVYVAAGRSEPWGMRLNDALQCGAPLLLSRGMGGVQMVDMYGCGMSFAKDDWVDLAHKLKLLINDKAFYLKCAKNALAAAEAVSVKNKAAELLHLISHS